MLIRLTKARHADRKHSLTIVRSDGSTTGMASSEFFVLHDLGHYAIETTLGFTEAFWGLLASGWDLTSFEERQAGSQKVRRVPPEGGEAELLAGLLDIARTNGNLTPEELLVHLEQICQSLCCPAPVVSLQQLLSILQRHLGLIDRWSAIVPGESLELEF